ncbi:MAG: DUF3343 domain-containing protein [Candidatus Methanoperedens sp.]|nr:DUF3343 domain-containing protein [Candidatus Methanoperedens sp.]
MGAVILFDEAGKAIRSEYILKKRGFSATLVAPPRGIRRGCDLSVKVEDSQQLQAIRLLDSEGISYLDLAAFTGGQGPVQLTTRKDIGEFIMVRSGNMKLTFSKDSGIIVNISGGGCPDIPYIANHLTNASLAEAESPLLFGTSLCAYLLDRALVEAKRIFAD